jgi:hypothetical protein
MSSVRVHPSGLSFNSARGHYALIKDLGQSKTPAGGTLGRMVFGFFTLNSEMPGKQDSRGVCFLYPESSHLLKEYYENVRFSIGMRLIVL